MKRKENSDNLEGGFFLTHTVCQFKDILITEDIVDIVNSYYQCYGTEFNFRKYHHNCFSLAPISKVVSEF